MSVKKTKKGAIFTWMCDHVYPGGYGGSCSWNQPPEPPRKAHAPARPFVPSHEPNPYNFARGTWFIPIGRNHELPIPSYPLLKDPNLYFTPGPSYLNMLANDPEHPLHYLAKKNGNRFTG